jgi:hypothetical protein
MSNIVDATSSTSVDDGRMAWFKDVISKLSMGFQNTSSQFQSHVQEVKRDFEELVGAMEREKIEGIICLIQEFKLNTAHQLLNARFPSLDLGTLQTILKLAYAGNASNIVKITNFSNELTSLPLKSSAFKALYEEIQFREHTSEVYILALKNCVEQIVGQCEDDLELCELKDALSVDKDDLIASVIGEDFKKGDFQKCILIYECLGPKILLDIMPAIVSTIFTGTVKNTLDFLKLLEALPCKGSVSLALEKAYNYLETLGQSKSEAALHLWAFCWNSLHTDACFSEYKDQINRILADFKKNTKEYFDIYQSYIDEPLTHDIAALHTKNPHLKAIVQEFTVAYQGGDITRVRPLIKAHAKIPNPKDCIFCLKTIYIYNLVPLNQLQTHEAFQLYRALQKYPSESYTAIKNCIPKCITTLLQSVSQKCRIVNKFYQEPLILVENSICTWIPRKATPEDKHWTILIDDETDLVKFKWDAATLEVDSTKEGTVKAPILSADGPGWKIKPVGDGQYLKIFKNGSYKAH